MHLAESTRRMVLCRFSGLSEQTRLHCWHRKYYVERTVVRKRFRNVSSTQREDEVELSMSNVRFGTSRSKYHR